MITRILACAVSLLVATTASAEFDFTAYTYEIDDNDAVIVTQFLAIDHAYDGTAENREGTPLFFLSYSVFEAGAGAYVVNLTVSTVDSVAMNALELGAAATIGLETGVQFTPNYILFDFGNTIATADGDGPGERDGLDIPMDDWLSSGPVEITYILEDGSILTALYTFAEPSNIGGEWYHIIVIDLNGPYGSATSFTISNSVR